MSLRREDELRYLKRSYSAVDGLWFMMNEEESGFEKALEIDNRVWAVMPKIQARFLKEVLNPQPGLKGLETCFAEKLRLDGFEFTIENSSNGFSVTLKNCPWHETMIHSGREHLSCKIGTTICETEYSGWAREFGDNIQAGITGRICAGEKECTIRFSLV
ncbi:MAG: hypothetical protein JW712_11245 [Dehalococcoidales bacterium]|nr:hypothetical protein [Dehalococcoidales bacterium]